MDSSYINHFTMDLHEDLQLEDVDSASILQYHYVNHSGIKRGQRNEGIEKTVKYFKDIFQEQKSNPQSNGISFTQFHAALVKNDMDFVTKTLDALEDPQIRQFACNSFVNFSAENITDISEISGITSTLPSDVNIDLSPSPSSSCKIYNSQLKFLLMFKLPLALASISGCMACVQVLLENGASIFTIDSNGNSIIHCLVYMSKINKKFAIDAYRKILNGMHSLEEKFELVMLENRNRFTAMDIAVKELCIDFISVIFRTEGVYRLVVQECGPFKHVLYDVSRYERDTTDHLPYHFLYHMALVTEDELENFKDCNIFKSEPFKSWVEFKRDKYKVQLTLWSLSWNIFFALMFTQTTIYYISDHHPIWPWLAILLLTLGSLNFLGTFYSIFTQKNVWKFVLSQWHTKGFPIAFKMYYQFFQIIFSSSVITIQTLHLIGYPCTGNHTLFTFLYLITVVFGAASVILFTQFQTKVGHLLVLIDRMVFDVILFLTIFSIIFSTFGMALTILHAEPMCKTDINHNTTGVKEADQNTRMFSSITYTMYESLIAGMTLIAPHPLHFESSHSSSISMITFVVFLVMISIIMLNLIIATMTRKVSFLNSHQETIKGLQSIILAQTIEEIWNFDIKWLNPYAYFQRKAEEKYLVKSKDGQSVFLHVVETMTPV